jgi:hypothetical protein
MAGGMIRGLTALLAAAALAACGPAEKASTPPIPPGAEPASLDGPYELELRFVISAVRETLRPELGSVHVQQFSLPEAATWSDVAAFYEAALGDDWTRDPAFAEQAVAEGGATFALGVWRKGASGREALAVGFAEALRGAPGPTLVMATPE